MAVLLTHDDVRDLLTMRDAIAALERAALEQSRGETRLPPRLTVDVPGGWLRMMPAALLGRGVMGFKEMHSTKGVGVRYLINLYDVASGALLAVMDADWITAMRTAATSALATRYLARPGVGRVGVLGSGEQARAHVRALAEVRRFADVRVYSPRPERRDAFAAWVRREFSCDAGAEDTAEDAVAGADVVIAAFRASGSPVLRAAWIRPGTHVVGISSVRPEAREIEDRVWALSDRVVVDDRAHVLESGDGRSAVASASLDPARAVELWEIVSGRAAGREGAGEITLFKSAGTALQDLAVAALVCDRAGSAGRGRDLGEFPRAKP